MKKYLLLYTLGPVQSYIEQAVKLHDLNAGSHILSILTGTALERINNSKSKIIFPYYNGKEDEKLISYPNRCVAIIETDDIKKYAQDLDRAVRNKYENLYVDGVLTEVGKKQLKSHLKTYWTANEYDECLYGKQYDQLQLSLGAIKGLQTFEQNPVMDDSRRCSICGERITVPHNGSKREKLCEVCYQKRKFEKTSIDPFPATSDVALAYWTNALQMTPKGEALLVNYKKLFLNGYSSDFLFESSLTKQNLNKQDVKDGNLSKMITQLKQMDQYVEDNHKLIKYHYYAMLAFDGDSMGKWIVGEYFKDGIDVMEAQNELSKALGDYANWVKTILKYISKEEESLLGRVIYAGGEDFLGVIPLNNLFQTMESLRLEFKKQISDKMQPYVKDNTELSFSIGVCIAHYKSPLYQTLKHVRLMEKKAKEYRDEKNALAICVLKRSGEQVETILPWQNNDDTYVTQTLLHILQIFKKYDAADSFVQKLLSEFFVLARHDNEDLEVPLSLIKSEMKRLINRIDIDKSSWDTEKKRLYSHINKLYEYTIVADEEYGNFKNFISALLVCEFIRREQNEN